MLHSSSTPVISLTGIKITSFYTSFKYNRYKILLFITILWLCHFLYLFFSITDLKIFILFTILPLHLFLYLVYYSRYKKCFWYGRYQKWFVQRTQSMVWWIRKTSRRHSYSRRTETVFVGAITVDRKCVSCFMYFI